MTSKHTTVGLLHNLATTDSDWLDQHHTPWPPDGETHVWQACLDAESAQVAAFLRIISNEEKTRAHRLLFAHDRNHFVIAHALLRIILGRYLGIEASQVQFAMSPFGKPSLLGQPANAGLCFNMSHSHGVALYAFVCGREVGIDIERIRPEVAHERIAERFFASSEIEALRSLAPSKQEESFFEYWARKEAYIKATGKGMSSRLDSFEISMTSGHPEIALRARGGATSKAQWCLHDLAPRPGYAAAVCVEGTGGAFKCWRCPREWVTAHSAAP